MMTKVNLIKSIFETSDKIFAIVGSDGKFIYANKRTSKLLFGLKAVNEYLEVTHDDYAGRAIECRDTFLAEDKLALSSQKAIKILGCYCYGKNDWHVLMGSKSLVNLDDKKVLLYDYLDVTKTRFRQLGMMLSDSHRKIFYDSDLKQISYIFTESYEELGLTKCQSECLFYLVQGKSSKETAKILQRSYRTVETHIDIIKSKLNCCSRSELVSKVFDLKLEKKIPSSVFGHVTDGVVIG